MRARGPGSKRSRPLLELLHRRAKVGLAQIRLGPSAPDDDLRNILHVTGKDDFLLVLVAEQSFLLEFVELINLAIGVHDLPVRIRSVRHDEIIGESKYTLAVATAVGHAPLVSLRALELAGSVCVLS